MKVRDAINDFLFFCQAQGLKERTVVWRRSCLKTLNSWEPEPGQAFGDFALEEVTDQLLVRYIAFLRNRKGLWVKHPYISPQKGKLKDSTVRCHAKELRTFFNWLVKANYIEKNPTKLLPWPRPLRNDAPQALEIEEIQGLIEAAEETGPRALALLLFALDTGCRPCEMVGLTTARLDLERGCAIVAAKGRARTVYFLEQTASALRTWLQDPTRKPGQAVFTGRKGPLTYQGLRRIFKLVGEKAGLEFRPYQLRHSFCLYSLRNGCNLAAVSRLMGHSSIRVTADVYGSYPDVALREEHSRSSPLLSL